ncbi:MAG: hypothetical protein KBC48_01590 [Candidatus Pacebacteria bacterium]|nr:hypothetical protein [Candidatus Paceibacterota bacterium]
MNPFSHKLLAILTISGFLVAPVSVIAQGTAVTFPQVNVEVLKPLPGQGGEGFDQSGSVFLQSSGSASGSSDQGTAVTFPQVNVQELGQGGLQQILGDRKSCEAEVPKAQNPTSALGRGLADGIAQSAAQAIKQGLPENMISYVQSDLPQRLTNNLQSKLGPEFANRLEAELRSGLDPADITDAMVEQLMRDSIDAVIKGSVQESVQDSIPRAISRSITEGMPAQLNQNVNSSIRSSLDGPFRNALNGLMNGEGGVGESLINGVLDTMSSQITNVLMSQLEGSMDEIVSSVTDGVMGSLDSSLNQITGDLTGSIDEIIGTLDGSLQDITNSLTDALTDPLNDITGNITDSIGDLTGEFQEALGGITDKLDEMTDELVGSITNPINELTDKLTGSIDKFTGQMSDAVLAPVNKVVEGATGAIEGVVDRVWEPVERVINIPLDAATNFVDGITGIFSANTIFGAGIPVVSGIPVYETGQLLQVTRQISRTEQAIQDNTANIVEITDASRKVLIEICGHIKDVRRIQLAFEQKEFVQDAQARQAAAEEVEKYSKAYLTKFIPEGYAVDGSGQKGSLLIENLDDYILEGTDEITKLFISEYGKNDSDIFNQQTKEALLKDISNSKYLPFSTITKEEYDKLDNPKDLSSGEFLTLLNKAYDYTKPNNPVSSYSINKAILETAQAISESNRVNELSSSGFKPVRECLAVGPDGKTCAKWSTVTPGSIIQENVGNVFDSRLEQLEQADEVTDIGEDTPIPTPAQSETFTPDDSTAGGSPGFNGNFAQNIFSGLLARLRGIFNNGGNGGSTGGGEEGEPPVVRLTFNTASVSEINGGEANAAFINLTTEGADKCVAGNTWLSLRPSGNKVEVAAAQGTDMGTSGSLKISLPLNFTLRLERTRGGEVTNFTPVSSVNGSLTQQVSSLNLGNAQVASGDIFKLVVKSINQEQSVSVTANSANAGTVVTALQQAVSLLSATSEQGKEFKALRLTFTANQAGEGFITATIDPIYRLTCSNTNGSTNASVTITR